MAWVCIAASMEAADGMGKQSMAWVCIAACIEAADGMADGMRFALPPALRQPIACVLHCRMQGAVNGMGFALPHAWKPQAGQCAGCGKQHAAACMCRHAAALSPAHVFSARDTHTHAS
eukprot:364290-Chlamydomonas_euryale.AAC.11